MRREIIVETFYQTGEASRNTIRLRPLPGQGYDDDTRVAYNIPDRYTMPEGTLLRIMVTEVHRYDCTKMYLRGPTVYTGEIVSRFEAEEFIRTRSRR